MARKLLKINNYFRKYPLIFFSATGWDKMKPAGAKLAVITKY